MQNYTLCKLILKVNGKIYSTLAIRVIQWDRELMARGKSEIRLEIVLNVSDVATQTLNSSPKLYLSYHFKW